MTNQTNVLDVTDFSKAEINKIIEELDKTDVQDTTSNIMKELLKSNEEDIHFKTDLNMNQIRAIVKIRTADDIMRIQSNDTLTEEEQDKQMSNVVYNMTELLMKLLVSKDRKGRREFIDAWIGHNEMQQGNGFFSRWLGKGSNI